MKILVTGGAGFAGVPLVELLLTLGHRVTVFDNFQWGPAPLAHLIGRPNFEVIQGDITNQHAVSAAVGEHDAVYHLAGLVGYPLCKEKPDQSLAINVAGTANVAAAAEGKPLIYASTGSVYGAVEDMCDESAPCNPQSEYGIDKLAAERIVLAAGGTALRLATLFGCSPCMRFDLLPNNFVLQAVKRGHLVLYMGSARRTFLHVRDAATAYAAALTNYEACKGQAFNVGDESLNLTKRELAEAIQEQVPFELYESGSGEDPDKRDYAVSYEKFRAATGFRARVQLSEAIAEIVRFAKLVDSRYSWRVTL